MNLSVNVLLLIIIILAYSMIFLVIRTLINKFSSLNDLFISNNKRLAFILSLLNRDLQTEFQSVREIKVIKENLIMEHMGECLSQDKIRKIERQEERNSKRRSSIKRKEASTYLGLIGTERCRNILEEALVKEKDYSVKIYISNALTDIQNPESLKVMIPELIDTRKWYREKAISNILEFGHDVHPYLMEVYDSMEIEHIELWIKYAGEMFNYDSKQYLLRFVDEHKRIREEIMDHYAEKKNRGKADYKIAYLKEDIRQLLTNACRTLANFYYEDFSLPKYYDHYDIIIQTNSFWALSKTNKKENFEILFSYITEQEHERTIVAVLKKMVEGNPRFLSILEDAFTHENNEIIQGRIAQILSSKIEYYILKLNTKHDQRAEEIIVGVLLNKKINELIGFLNMNKNHDIENRLIQILKDHIPVNSEAGLELRVYLKKEIVKKWGTTPLEADIGVRKNQKDPKLIRIILFFTAVTVLMFPILFFVIHFDFIVASGMRLVLKKYVIEFNYGLAFYSIAINVVYILLLMLSYRNVRIQSKLWNLKNMITLFRKKMLPSISIIAPAYNEEMTIVESAKSLLHLNYPDYELIIVNDGSKDETLNILIETFQLTRVDYIFKETLRTAPILGIYRNPSYPKLVVVNKGNGGKADSLNAGINVSNKTYFCGIDADSLLEPDSLLKLASLTLDESTEIPALGGNIFPINGCKVDKGFIEKVKIPKNKLARFQTIEYLRSFMAGRLGWEKINSLLIISGAFGLFRKERIIEIGGYLTEKGKYKKDTVGEDMELVVRISRRMYEMKHSFKIRYCFNANCWTEVPEDLKSLKSQRYRWHRGLIDILFFHRKMIGNPRYGNIGTIALPYFLIFEAIGPVIEIQGYFMVVLAAIFGILNIQIALLLFISVVLFGVIVSLSSVLIAEREHHYFSVPDTLKLMGYAFIENFGVRQLFSFWRLGGQMSIIFGKGGWGQIKRKGQKNE